MISKPDFETLIKIVDTLNYYQLLKVAPTATENEIQDAFHREALLYHPDRYQGIGDQQLLNHAKQVYGKIVQAYRTLSSSLQRENYDMRLRGVEPVVKKQSGTEESASKPKKSTASTTGIRFYKLAQSAAQSGNLSSAKMNIQLALNTDPENEEFKQLLQRIDSGLKKSK